MSLRASRFTPAAARLAAGLALGPVASGATTLTFGYTGSVDAGAIPQRGIRRVTVGGAGGGDAPGEFSSRGGAGGALVSGKVRIAGGTPFEVLVGGNGESVSGGFGGGQGGGGDDGRGGGGGGGSFLSPTFAAPQKTTGGATDGAFVGLELVEAIAPEPIPVPPAQPLLAAGIGALVPIRRRA